MRPSRIVLMLVATCSLALSCAKMPTSPKVMVPVSGTILDRDGHGIQAVYVIFEGPMDVPALVNLETAVAVTDVNGRFSCQAVEGDYRVTVVPPRFSAYAGTYLLGRHIGRAGAVLTYRFPWKRLAARASFTGSQNAADFRLYAFPDSDGIFSQISRLSGNEQEVFLAPGTYEVKAVASGVGFGYFPRDITIQLAADTTMDVEFSGNAVSVHVVGQGGAPLAGGGIWATSSMGTTGAKADAGGAATLYVPSGIYALMARGPTDDVLGRVIKGIPISGDASFDFDLSGIVWTGVVRRASSGSPVASVEVDLYDPSQPSLYATSVTDAGGAFHFIVPSGRVYQLAVFQLFGSVVGELGHLDSVPAGADSTFDIPVSDTPTAPSFLRPAPPAGRDAPASAAAGRGSPRRSSRTSG